MMKIWIIIVAILFGSTSLEAKLKMGNSLDTTQNYISVSMMGATISPTDLHGKLAEIQDEQYFRAKFTDDFPMTAAFFLSMYIDMADNIYMRPQIFFHSTGARIHSADYTGEYSSDVILDSWGMAFGIVSLNLGLYEGLRAGLSLDLGFVVKDIEFIDKLIIESETIYKKKKHINEKNAMLKPGALITYTQEKFQIIFSAEYLWDIQIKQGANQGNISNVSGLRFGLSFGMSTKVLFPFLR